MDKEGFAIKALGDVFESLAGAVFVDSGFSLEVIWRVFKRLLLQALGKLNILIDVVTILL